MAAVTIKRWLRRSTERRRTMRVAAMLVALDEAAGAAKSTPRARPRATLGRA
jgi:hypothetical protein